MDGTPGSKTAKRTLFDAIATRRVIAAVIGACCLALLLLAASLKPDPSGTGTHTQLGLPTCGWVLSMDLPCPTCGYTTAFTATVHGRFLEGFLAQPVGAILALATAVFFLGSMLIVLTGAPLENILGRFWTPRVTWTLLAVIILAWVYKMLRFRGIF